MYEHCTFAVLIDVSCCSQMFSFSEKWSSKLLSLEIDDMPLVNGNFTKGIFFSSFCS